MGEILKTNPENGLILTAASNVQKYRIWPVLPQFEDAWICRHPDDPELREPELQNAEIWVDLNMKHNVTTLCESGREQQFTL